MDEAAGAGRGDGRGISRSGESQHLQEVLDLVEAIACRDEVDVESVLRSINDVNVRFVPGALHAGITMLDRSGAISSVGATHTHPRLLDDVQRETNEGPCLSAASTGHTIRIDDLATEQRWPHFTAEALPRTSVRSVLSFRLFHAKSLLAALNFYAPSTGVFSEDSLEHGLIASAHTVLAWNVLRRERQFRDAVASRDVIGQAKGILMERYGITAFGAFDLLKQLSQDSNTRLIDVAGQVVARDDQERPPTVA